MTKFAEPSFPAIFTEHQAELRPLDKDLLNTLGQWALVLKGILDGGVSFSDNMDASFASFTSSATPDAEDTVAHGLGKTPSYYVVVSLNKGAVIYKSSTAFTATNAYLKCNVASTTATIMFF